MDRLILFFQQNPILLFVAVAWILGMIGNAAKVAKGKRQRTEMARLPESPSPTERVATPVRSHPVHERSADEIAREMRRLLGVETEPSSGDRSSSPAEASEVRQPRPTVRPTLPASLPSLPSQRRRNVPELEHAPTPVRPTTSSRRLPIHVDPHVGEGISRRVSVQSGRVGESARAHTIGNLGGRVVEVAHRAAVASRYALTDLKRAIVLSEILGPPMSLRRGREVDS